MKRTTINKIGFTLGLFAISILWNACRVSIPKGAKAVSPFDTKKYLGKWYEIARMDFKFEKNLNNVTASYSMEDGDQIRVDNRGYDTVKKAWKQSIGKAKLLNQKEARLKVSFFGPFYAGYNVIAIDPEYRYTLVAGNSLDYLWILSRSPILPELVKRNYLNKAKELGYRTEDLVWTVHNNQR